MANERYFAMGQCYVANGTGVITEVGRQAASGATTLHVTTQGNFTFTMANGTTATVASGTATVSGSPQTLSAGANTVTVTGTGTITLTLTTVSTTANTNTVNSWSATDGGAVGASIPISTNSVLQASNAFTNSGQIMNVDATLSCLDFNMTGATNNPTLTMISSNLCPRGNVTFISNMVVSAGSGELYFNAGTPSLTSNNLVLGCRVKVGGATLTVNDNLNNTLSSGSAEFDLNSGTLILANGISIQTKQILISGIGAKTLTPNNAVINGISYSYSGSNLTVDANTATINISGTGALAAGNVNYNGTTFNLNGTAHTVSGNFTANLGFNPAGDQTIKWTDGMAITVTDMFRGGTGLITWPQSGPLGFDIIKYGGGYLNSRIFHTHQHFSQIVVIPPICPPGKMTSARLTRLGGFN